MTNIHRREPFRHHSCISSVADVVIAGAGAGPHGYVMAVGYLAEALCDTGRSAGSQSRRARSTVETVRARQAGPGLSTRSD